MVIKIGMLSCLRVPVPVLTAAGTNDPVLGVALWFAIFHERRRAKFASSFCWTGQ